MEIFACPNRRFLGNYLSKRQVERVLAKSLPAGLPVNTCNNSMLNSNVSLTPTGQAAQNDELKSELEGIIAGLQGYLSDIKGQQERQRRAYDELLLERDVLQEKLEDMEAEMSVLDAEGGDTRSMVKVLN